VWRDRGDDDSGHSPSIAQCCQERPGVDEMLHDRKSTAQTGTAFTDIVLGEGGGTTPRP
jgi:hypothetical protein